MDTNRIKIANNLSETRQFPGSLKLKYIPVKGILLQARFLFTSG
jgi:hypothetical protein